VRFPGTYPIQPGVDTVAELIERAGGWTSWSNRNGAHLRRRLVDAVGERRPGTEGDQQPISGRPVEQETARLEQRDWPRDVQVDWPRETLAVAGGTTLEAGDILYVPRLQGRVVVDGRVRKPGMVAWQADLRVRDYIELAGGFDRGANHKRLLLRRVGRPSGELEEVKQNDTLRDGDLVWVPEKQPRSLWALTREIVSFLAQVATVVIIIDQATSN
jgi:protein involved in polysaccharide export with SLBB domain